MTVTKVPAMEVARSTDKAVLVVFRFLRQRMLMEQIASESRGAEPARMTAQVWIPKSCCRFDAAGMVDGLSPFGLQKLHDVQWNSSAMAARSTSRMVNGRVQYASR